MSALIHIQHYPALVPNGTTVIIAGAMGVPQSFYRHFAQWLSEQGFHAVTFDYEGVGQSLNRHLRDNPSTITDWAERDCRFALQNAKQAYPDNRIVWLGHSLGGQMYPMVPNIGLADKIITLASGSGYWRLNRRKVRIQALLLWYCLVPLLTSSMGYFPGKSIGAVGDLPSGVIRQWRQWCLHPNYLAGVEAERYFSGLAQVPEDICAFTVADDELLGQQAVTRLHENLHGKQVRHQTLHPDDAGVKRIGHFNLFKPQFRDTLWQAKLLPELTH